MIDVRQLKIREQDRCVGGYASLVLCCINLLVILTEGVLIIARRADVRQLADLHKLKLPPLSQFFVHTLSTTIYISAIIIAFAAVIFFEFRIRNEKITARHQLIILVLGLLGLFLFMILVPLPQIPQEGVSP